MYTFVRILSFRLQETKYFADKIGAWNTLISLQGIWPNLYLRISDVYAQRRRLQYLSMVDTDKTAKF